MDADQRPRAPELLARESELQRAACEPAVRAEVVQTALPAPIVAVQPAIALPLSLKICQVPRSTTPEWVRTRDVSVGVRA